MMTDPISDLLTRIRNASTVHKVSVSVPFSKLKFEIAKILKHEDYVEEVAKVEEAGREQLQITLKYVNQQPAIQHIQRVSKPGRRVYTKNSDLPKVLNGLGMAILSTPKGLMTNKQAKRDGLGGEVICEVW